MTDPDTPGDGTASTDGSGESPPDESDGSGKPSPDGSDGPGESPPDGSDGSGSGSTEAPAVEGGPTYPEEWTVLAPIRILEGDSFSGGVVEFLSTLPVVVLGYHVVPDQTPPGQARMQFEDRAESALAAVATEFREAGGTVETRLVFTDDRDQTFDRVAAETGAAVLLLRNPVAHVDRLLVAVRGEVNVARIADFVATLVADRGIGVTLFRAVGAEAAVADAEALLSEVADRLAAAGVDPGTVERTVAVADDALPAIVAAAADHDAVVMGESEPTLSSFVFGDLTERVADRTVGPVLVVKGGGRAGPEPDPDEPGHGDPDPDEPGHGDPDPDEPDPDGSESGDIQTESDDTDGGEGKV